MEHPHFLRLMIVNVYGIKLIRKTTIMYSYAHTLFINLKHI
jgi:hypothetical protein